MCDYASAGMAALQLGGSIMQASAQSSANKTATKNFNAYNKRAEQQYHLDVKQTQKRMIEEAQSAAISKSQIQSQTRQTLAKIQTARASAGLTSDLDTAALQAGGQQETMVDLNLRSSLSQLSTQLSALSPAYADAPTLTNPGLTIATGLTGAVVGGYANNMKQTGNSVNEATSDLFTLDGFSLSSGSKSSLSKSGGTP